MPFWEIILLTGITVFITHSLEAVTGFGCAVLAMPFVIALMGDIAMAKIILSILALVLALYFVITGFRKICWKELSIITAFALAGMPIGMYIFRYLDASLLVRLLGVFIALSSIVQLVKIFRSGMAGKENVSVWSRLYLFLGGIVHGAFATGGPLIILYSAKKIHDKGRFRATMCMLWTILNTILLAGYIADGCITRTVSASLAALLPFLAAGIVAGEYLHRKVNELMFRKIVFSALALVGVVMVLT